MLRYTQIYSLPGAIDVHTGRVEDFFDAWVFAAGDAERALAGWEAAAVCDRSNAYAAYRAALDREEQAAEVLAAVVLRTR